MLPVPARTERRRYVTCPASAGMERTRLVPSVGIVACLAVVFGLAVPYGLVGEPSAVGAYYASGAFNPLFAGLFALVGALAFAAGREGRSDPALMAGATLVVGLFVVLLVVAWALTVPVDLVLSLGTNTLVEYHRHALVGAALSVPSAAGWYARTLGLV